MKGDNEQCPTEAGKLESREAKVSITGAGDATVWAHDSVDVKIVGSGDVSYYGDAKLSKSVMGSGSAEHEADAQAVGTAIAEAEANLLTGGPMPMVAVWLLSISNGSPWAVVALCASLNLISLIAILWGPETRGIDMNQTDSLAVLAGTEDAPSSGAVNATARFGDSR